jgi:hypothetical protein
MPSYHSFRSPKIVTLSQATGDEFLYSLFGDFIRFFFISPNTESGLCFYVRVAVVAKGDQIRC